jgi:hypothetical protein
MQDSRLILIQNRKLTKEVAIEKKELGELEAKKQQYLSLAMENYGR